MAGLLSGILGVVGIVAGVATGNFGLIAGGILMLGSAAAQAGIIGGSIGKFMKGPGGMALIAAVTLGSAAYSYFGQTAAGAQATNMAASTQAATASTVGPTAIQDTSIVGGDMQAAAGISKSFMDTAQITQGVGQLQLQNPALGQVGGVSPETYTAEAQQYAGTTPNANAMGATAQGQTAVEGASPLVKGPMAAAGTGEGGGFTPGTPAPGGASLPTNPDGSPGLAGEEINPNPGASGGPVQAGSMPPATPSGGGGLLDKAMGFMNTKGGSALVQGAGHMLGGVGQGIMQKQAMEDQLKAAQWGNMQWQNSGQIAKMQSAAAAPITVPQGYLQRAQQVRTLMQGGQGMQPLPTAQPGAPLAPSPLPVVH